MSEKSRSTTFLLCYFLGIFGVHRFYLGKVLTGLLMLITLGGLTIWWLIDAILIAAGQMKDKQGMALRGGPPDPQDPRAYEVLLGLDPESTDSDGDGTPDGEEDFDNDGLSNAGEVLLLSDPTNEDSDGDGTPDGDEDTDFDFVPDGEEVRRGSDPRLIDTDGDGVADVDEFATNTDPTDASSLPPRRAQSTAVAYLNAVLASPATEISVSSAPVSYLNALQSNAEEQFVTSQVVSYENQ